jgi:peptidoglycan-associated lipoprotein
VGLALAAIMLVLTVPGGALAQSREVLLGTITAGEPTSTRDRGRAAELLADGMSALERGDVMLGRRRLEVLVERYPDSAAAAVARGELGALYSNPPSPDWTGRDGDLARQSADGAEAEPLEQKDLSARPFSGREPARDLPLARQRQLEDDRRLQVLALEFQTSAGDRVFFAESSADLGAKARAVLAAQARWLTRHPELPITVEAHADDHLGNRELDIRLAEKRGQAVRERLLEEGIAADRVTVLAFGRDRPVATCNSPECAVQNRRVVTRIGFLTAPDSVARRGIEAPAFATIPREGWRRGAD